MDIKIMESNLQQALGYLRKHGYDTKYVSLGYDVPLVEIDELVSEPDLFEPRLMNVAHPVRECRITIDANELYDDINQMLQEHPNSYEDYRGIEDSEGVEEFIEEFVEAFNKRFAGTSYEADDSINLLFPFPGKTL